MQPLPRSVYGIFALTTVLFLTAAIMTPVLEPLVRRPFGLTNRESSWFLSINAIPTLLFALIAGWFSDRLNSRITLLGPALLGAGLLLAALPHIPSFRLLLAARFLQGIFETVGHVLLLAWALDVSGPANRGRVFALITVALPMAYIGGPLLAGWLGEGHLPGLLAGLGSIMVAAGLIVMTIARGGGRVAIRKSPPSEIIAVFRRSPRLALPLTFGFIDKMTFGFLAVLTGFVPTDVFGIETVGAVSAPLIAFWAGFVVFIWPSGILCDRLGALLPLLMGSSAYGLALIFMASGSYTQYMALMGAAGAFSAFMYLPSVTLIGRYSGAENRGVAMGAFNTVGTGGLICGFIIAGRLSDIGYATAYAFAGGLEIIAVVAVGGALLKWRGRLAEPEGT